MNELLQLEEPITDEEAKLCVEAARLWEEQSDDEQERIINNGDIQRKR